MVACYEGRHAKESVKIVMYSRCCAPDVSPRHMQLCAAAVIWFVIAQGILCRLKHRKELSGLRKLHFDLERT